jgi:uncharacterized protein involved in type VI secretion and phage assembly
MTSYFGKYRGKVETNVDPNGLGRVQVSVPAVYGNERMNWAMPCVPYAGDGVGWFAIPPEGANVWVEFEGGDLNYPIWSGCFWDRGEVPISPAVAEKKVLKTEGVTVTIDDTSGSEAITIETRRGMKVALSSEGIELSNGQGAKVKLSGSQVTVNDGALEVT